ncbi:hypothetical protein C0J52_09396 [Blattella germanica]|nr:hypothetical protein C0J52_09396 [Blattella germanica]
MWTDREEHQEHKNHIKRYLPEKLAVAIERQHRIQFEEATVLHRTRSYKVTLVKEAIEIKLNTNNFNMDAGL